MFWHYQIENVNGADLINCNGDLFCLSLADRSCARHEERKFYTETLECDPSVVDVVEQRLGAGGRLEGVIGVDVLKKLHLKCDRERREVEVTTSAGFVADDVVDVLIYEPSLGMVFDWGSICSPIDWMRLLAVRGEFAVHCPINHNWENIQQGAFALIKPRIWKCATRPIVVIPLKEDIKRTARSEPDGEARYPFSKRFRLEDYNREVRNLRDRLESMLAACAFYEAVSIDGENLDGGSDNLNATSFVSAVKAWLKANPSSIKILYLEYVAGVAMCAANVLSDE